MSLQLEPGLAKKYRSLRRATADVVYRSGLDRCAIAADEGPGNFSKSLADRQKGDTTARRFDLDALEAVLDETRDYTPIYYLIDKYLRDDQARRDEAISRLGTMLPELTQLLKLAGVA
ncbi:MAG: hypothetical protein ABS82_00275 [Rhodanobacter sp. SCN 67-45]|nr:MAG: hypothetical protein ABS82_00275 [Rhodanobacter sp. SCN 67-45]